MSQRRPLEVGRQHYFHWILPVVVEAGLSRDPPAPASGAKNGSGRQHNPLDRIVPERDPTTIPTGREINSDGQHRLVGRDNVFTAKT